uniref:Uncharacterized protein n=1 Tax=Acrobeloides nanus TaxID=290746 RepID=A0A914CUG2_9BILA
MIDNSLVTGEELNNTTSSSSLSIGAFTSRQDFLNGLNNIGNYAGKLRLDSWLQEAATRFPSSSSTTTSFIVILNHHFSFALPADQGVAAAASLATNLQRRGQFTLIALRPNTMAMSRLYSITPNFVEWNDLPGIPLTVILALRAGTMGGGSRGETTKGWTTPDYEYSGSGSGENQGSGGSQGNTTKGWTTPDYEGSGGSQGNTTKGWTTPDYEGSGIGGSGGYQGETTKGWTTPDYKGSGGGGSQGNTTKVWPYWWTTPDYKSSSGGGSQGNTTKGPYWLPYWNVPAKVVFQNH